MFLDCELNVVASLAGILKGKGEFMLFSPTCREKSWETRWLKTTVFSARIRFDYLTSRDSKRLPKM